MRPDWIEVGRVSRAHGIQGEVRVVPSTDNPERFAPGSRLHARLPGDERRPLEVTQVRGDAALPIVAFRDVASRNEAEALRGAVLEVPGADLPELAEGEYYPFQLEGLEVRDPDGAPIGRVVELVDAPANDILVVRLEDGRELLLPFVEEAIPTVDLAGGYVTVAASFLLPFVEDR